MSGFIRRVPFRSAFSKGCSLSALRSQRLLRSRRFYSTKIVYDGPERKEDALTPYIKSCLPAKTSGYDVDDDCGFRISFLGTGGGKPNTLRITSATLLQLGGVSFLFDAGEGTQRQLMFSKVKLKGICKIFITHLHADHILGLPGVLLQLQDIGRSRQSPQVIEIYGPPGIYNFIAANFALTKSAVNFNLIRCFIFELVGGTMHTPPSRGPKKHQRNILHSHYPEISNLSLIRGTIKRNRDGTWTIQKPGTPTKKQISSNRRTFNDENAGSYRQVNITAAEVIHLDGVQTFGFVVEELEPPRTIDPARAKAMGVQPGPNYRILKNGYPVWSDDGKTLVQPEDVLTGMQKKARKFALFGDNCAIPASMSRLCKDADVLVHEATMRDSREASEKGHATPEMAGRLAKLTNAKVLVLNHISPAIQESDEMIAEQAASSNDGVSHIITAYDFLELWVPREGFPTGDEMKQDVVTPNEKSDQEEGLLKRVKGAVFG